MRENTRTRRLQTWIVASSAVGIICVGVIVATAGIYPLYDHLIVQEEKNLLLNVNSKTLAVEEFLARARDITQQISSRTEAREKLQNFNKGKINLAELQSFTEENLLDAMFYTEEIWGITRYDAVGRVVLILGLDVPDEVRPKFDLASKNPKFSGPISIGRQSFLVISSPILSRSSEFLGHDLVVFRLDQLEKIMFDEPDDNTDTFLGLVRNNQVDLIFPHRTNHSVSQTFPFDSGVGKAMQLATQKKSGMLFTSGPGNRREVLAYGPIKGADWGLVLKIDRNELYAPVNKHVLATMNLIVAMLVVGTMVMILFVRPLTGKMIIQADELEREVQAKTADLQKELQERKRMEQWLMDSERRYRTLVEEVPDGIFILDENGKFDFVNTQMEHLLGYEVSALLDTSLQDHVAEGQQEKIDALFNAELDSIWDEEITIKDSKGDLKFARARVKMSQVYYEKTIRFEGVMRDITRRKKLEEELKNSRIELLEKIKIIDDLYEHIVQTGKAKAIADHTAEVAHELRQPLAIIGGFARRMAKQFDSCELLPESGQKESCAIMISEIQRLERILTSLIEFTRHETVRLELANPNEIVQKLLQVHEPRMEEKNLRFRVHLGPEVGELPLDPNRFEQVIRNLLSNAIEASPENSIIEIETAAFVPSEKAVEAGQLESEMYFELKIKNQGNRISPEDLQKIFNPFHTTKNYGTGIGLTISKRIIEEHKGSISVKSDESGIVFTIWLPILHQSEVPTQIS